MSIGRSFPLKLCLPLTRSMSTQRPTYVMFLHVGRVFFLFFQFVLYFPLARVCPSFGTLTPGNNAPPIQGVSLTLVFLCLIIISRVCCLCLPVSKAGPSLEQQEASTTRWGHTHFDQLYQPFFFILKQYCF